MNDIEMLNRILQNAEMGCQGITSIRKRTKKKAVDHVLCNQLAVAKAMTRIAAMRDLQRDASSSHIAEMMIKGNTMGVNKMVQHLREYDRTNTNITLLAKKMLDTEEEHIRELRAFI